MKIIGHGGADSPTIAKNTLQCKTVGRGLDVLCEGEIAGLVAGDKSVFFNDVPLIGSDGALNFSGVTIMSKNGSSSQSYLPQFSAVESMHSVGIEVTQELDGVVKAITNTSVDDVRVIISIPSLVKNKSDGSRVGTTVSYSILIQAEGQSWRLVDLVTVAGKCQATFLVPTRISNLEENYGKGPWNIKVIRNTLDAESEAISNKTYFSSFVTIINDKITYPDTAYVGFEIDAELFGMQIPSRTYHVKGTKVKIPTGYNPVERSYPTIWNGTFEASKQYTNNPVWILYDLITNKRYGMGVDETYIDKWAFYTASKYCDELVSDGFDGQEPRYTFNALIQTQEDAFHIIAGVASSFHSKLLWSNSYISIMLDHPRHQTKIVSPANVIDGAFNYAGTGLKNRKTVVAVAWNDPKNRFKKTHEVVEDKDAINRYGYNQLDIVGFGCTSRAQARRFGKWVLFTELYQTETIAYRAGLDHIDVLPGDVIEVRDPSTDTEISDGGRVVSAIGTWIKLDRPVSFINTDLTPENDYSISVISKNGDLETRAITHVNEDTTEIIVDIEFASDNLPQPNAMWGIGNAIKGTKLFQVISKKELEPHIYEISALIYLPEKYAIIDGDGSFKFGTDEVINNIPEGILAPPTELVAKKYAFTDAGIIREGALLSFTHSTDARLTHYEIEAYIDGELPTFIKSTVSNTLEITDYSPDTYHFRIRAAGVSIKSGRIYSTWCLSSLDDATIDDIDGSGVTVSTPNVVGLEIKGQGNDTIWREKDLHLSWMISQPIDYAADTESGAATQLALLDMIKHYVVKIYNTDSGALIKEDVSQINSYVFTYANNMLLSGTGYAIPNLTIKITAISKTGVASIRDAVLSVNNIAPMPVSNLRSQSFSLGARFMWDLNRDIDFSHFKYSHLIGDEESEWIDTPGTALNVTLSATQLQITDVSIRLRVKAVDTFGLMSAYVETTETIDRLHVEVTDPDSFALTASNMFMRIPILENEVWTSNPELITVGWNQHNLYYAGEKHVIAAGKSEAIGGEIVDSGGASIYPIPVCNNTVVPSDYTQICENSSNGIIYAATGVSLFSKDPSASVFEKIIELPAGGCGTKAILSDYPKKYNSLTWAYQKIVDICVNNTTGVVFVLATEYARYGTSTYAGFYGHCIYRYLDGELVFHCLANPTTDVYLSWVEPPRWAIQRVGKLTTININQATGDLYLGKSSFDEGFIYPFSLIYKIPHDSTTVEEYFNNKYSGSQLDGSGAMEITKCDSFAIKNDTFYAVVDTINIYTWPVGSDPNISAIKLPIDFLDFFPGFDVYTPISMSTIDYDTVNDRVYISISRKPSEMYPDLCSRVGIISGNTLNTIIKDYEDTGTFVNGIMVSERSGYTHFWETNDEIDLFYIYGNTSTKTGKQYIYWNNPENVYHVSDVHPADAGVLNIEDGYIIAVNLDGVCHPNWNAQANQVIGSAYIMNAAIGDLQVDSISANKIKADTIMTPGVKIGGMEILPGLADPLATQDPGLYINSEKMGYYENGWRTYQDNQGNFAFGKTGTDKSIRWNAALGQLIVGTNNIVIDAEDNSIIIAAGDGKATNDYAILKDGSIELYKYKGGSHTRYKFLPIIRTGEAKTGERVNFGYFDNEPHISMTIVAMKIFSTSYDGSEQYLKMDVKSLSKNADGTWSGNLVCVIVSEPDTEIYTPTIIPLTYNYNTPLCSKTGKIIGTVDYLGTEETPNSYVLESYNPLFRGMSSLSLECSIAAFKAWVYSTPHKWGWVINYYTTTIKITYTLRNLSDLSTATDIKTYSYSNDMNNLDRGYPISVLNTHFINGHGSTGNSQIPYYANMDNAEVNTALSKLYAIRDTFEYEAQDGWEVIGFSISKDHQNSSVFGPHINIGVYHVPFSNFFKWGICIEKIKAVTSTTEPVDDTLNSIVRWTAIEKAIE